MSVGLLLITHNQIGSSLLETTTRILGGCPVRAEALDVPEETNSDLLRLQARRMAERLDTGEGVLVLTDLFGSTPANIANGLQEYDGIRVLTGVNLPMLVRVLNYPTLGLGEMTAKALSGGKDGVLLCPGSGRERK